MRIGPGALEHLQQHVSRLCSRDAVASVDDEKRHAADAQLGGLVFFGADLVGVRVRGDGPLI